MSNFYQLSFFDINKKFRKFLTENSSNFIELLKNYIPFSKLIPSEFKNTYYNPNGRNRDYSIESMLMFFIYKNLRSISKDKILLGLLKDSPDLRMNLGFDRVPDASQISRFKTNFKDQLHLTLDSLVSIVNKELKDLGIDLTKILIADTTGFEAYVEENNPKFLKVLISNAKSYEKSGKAPDDFDSIKYAHSQMPKEASKNNDIKLKYLCGHFGYYLPAMIITNGIGIIQDIQFPDEVQDFTDNKMPDEIKDEYDSKTLIPSLEIYFSKQSNENFEYFLGDSGFDGYYNYKYIFNKGLTPVIPINQRNGKTTPNCFRYSEDNPDAKFYFDSKGDLICKNADLPMKKLGPIKSDDRADRYSYGCPHNKTYTKNGEYVYVNDCENPCSDAIRGRKKNIALDEEYRFNTKLPRNTDKWQNLYKKRTVCERTIAQLKEYINIKASLIRNTKSLKSTILLAGISQLIGVLIMIKSKELDNLRSFKSAA